MTDGRHKFVAAIYLNHRGFAFVIFRDGLKLLDWGVIEVRGSGKRDKILARIGRLLPSNLRVLVLQMMLPTEIHRPKRMRRLNDAIAELAKCRGMQVVFLSRNEIRVQFAHLGIVSRTRIAAAIARQVPAFARYLPRPKKPWKSEAARMAIFDAAALALSFYHERLQAGANQVCAQNSDARDASPVTNPHAPPSSASPPVPRR